MKRIIYITLVVIAMGSSLANACGSTSSSMGANTNPVSKRIQTNNPDDSTSK